MNTAILKRLSVDQLNELQKAVSAELAQRMDFRVLPGRTGYFIDGDNKIFVTVERINSKSVTVRPIGGGRGGWRVSASLLVMDGVPAKGQTIAATVPSASPADTYDVAVW